MYEVSKEKLKILREKYPPGTRVRLNVMRDEPQMRAGLKGTAMPCHHNHVHRYH